MTNEKPQSSAMIAIPLAMLAGAALGVAMVVWGTAWQSPVTGLDWHELTSEAVVGAIAGAVMGLVLHLTRTFRSRGEVQHYTAWMLGGVLGLLVTVIPDVVRGDFSMAPLVLWGGAFGGLSFGAVARYIASKP